MISYLRDPGEPFKRLFFALACPPEQRRAISRWRSTLDLGNGRRVPAENFHLTLLFLGEVGLAHLPALLAAAASVTPPGEHLRVPLDRLDAWRRSGVLLLAPEEPPPPLLRLAYNLQQAVQPLGLLPEHTDYRPHLTLARDYRAEVPEAGSPPEFQLTASHFTLFESRKGQYLPLQEWPLA
ncbi:RNA 2',3'-cyclic phosphodiesterase [Pseudomonas sp. RIT-PI-S]|uniref:RNA 2',3'-cyclic phosphodiesterase n=1 Tax=Pseudomonas sp. RIT-PI-S TaxID=3035295 RepID=UPI0021D85A25|nr:RNA 2',3'-cyclic phosphodiesterase [Pseudomonas sp. RIT-PI-S]